MVAKQSQFATVLKQHKRSLTKPRQAVFEALVGHEPQTMHQLLARLPQIDRATVYRTVDLLEALDVIKRLQIGWKYKLELSDAFSSHHHHLTCTVCGRVISVAEDPRIEQRIKALVQQHGFTLRDHQLEIQGICRTCRNR